MYCVKTGTCLFLLSSFCNITRGEEGQLANIVQNTVDAFDLTREINIL